MKKLLKFLLWTALALVLLVILLVALLPVWLGPVARPIVNRVVPQLTRTDFRLGRLAVNPFTGRLEVGDLKVGNPKGYSEPVACSLGGLVVVLDTAQTTPDRIHVREVTVNDVFVSYLVGGENSTDNVTQIKMNLAGGKERYEQAKRLEKARAQAHPPSEAQAADEGRDVKVVIDRLTISGVRVKLQMLTILVPSITLTDIGKDSDGATLDEALTSVFNAIVSSASALGDGASALGDILTEATGEGLGALQDAGRSAGDSVKKTAEALKGLFGSRKGK